MRKFSWLFALLLMSSAVWSNIAGASPGKARFKVSSSWTYDSNSPLITDVSQLSANSIQPNDGGGLAALIDGSTGTYFHSGWSDEYVVNAKHYLQVAVHSHAVQKIMFTFHSRLETHDSPSDVTIYATNDTTNKDSWKEITELKNMIEGNPDDYEYTSPMVDLGASYTDVRFVVNCTTGGSGRVDDKYQQYYFNMSEFQLYDAVEVKDPSKVLQQLVDSIVALGRTYPGGTDPGCFPSDKVSAYATALAAAQTGATEEHSADEYKVLINDLRKAFSDVESSGIAITDGYYYFVNAYPAFLSKQGVQKAMYAKGDMNLYWADFDSLNANYIFRISKLADGNWSIQSFGQETYINTSSGTSSQVPLSKIQTTDQLFQSLGHAQWRICNTLNSIAYHPNSHGNGSGKNGNIVTWNTGVNGQSAWFLRKINKESLIDSLAKAKVQTNLNDTLSALINDAVPTYSSNFIYSHTHPLITAASDTIGACQFYSNAKEPTEGKYANLIDSNHDTFFHSQWSGTGPAEKHYLQVDLSSTPVDKFIFSTWRRTQNNNNRPTSITITATNDTTGGGTWQPVTTINYGLPTLATVSGYASDVIDMKAAYKYVRFTVNTTNTGATNNGQQYFTYSEFQMYPVEIDQTSSQYYYVPGMKDACDALSNQITSAKAILTAGNTTQADIDALRHSLDAVKALHADTTALSALIHQAQTLVDSVLVGNAIGYLTDESAKAPLQAAVTMANGFDRVAPLKTTLDASLSTLQQAVETFLSKIVTISPQVWYYVKSMDTSRKGGDKTPVTGGSVIYASGNSQGNNVLWAASDGVKTSDNDPYCMWRFVPIEGTSYYAMQNMATGFYMGDFGGASTKVTLSATAVPYTVSYNGKAAFVITPMTATNTSHYPLHAQVDGRLIVTWPASIGGPSTWTFQAVPDDVDAINLKVLNNNIDIFTLPYAVADLSDINPSVKTYAIQKVVSDASGINGIALTERSSFAAGEPFVMKVGDYTLYNDSKKDTTDITMARPSTVVDKPSTANGLIGCLTNTSFTKSGIGYFDKALLQVTSGAITISGHSGFINPLAVVDAGGETALVLTLKSGTMTAIRSALSSSSSELVNVYSLDGRLLSSGVKASKATQGLQKGIYIIGKKKVSVR